MVFVLSDKYRFPLTSAISPREWASAEWAMVPNDAYAASQFFGFCVRMLQYMRRPVTAINVQPCWNFFLWFFVFSLVFIWKN